MEMPCGSLSAGSAVLRDVQVCGGFGACAGFLVRDPPSGSQPCRAEALPFFLPSLLAGSWSSSAFWMPCLGWRYGGNAPISVCR